MFWGDFRDGGGAQGTMPYIGSSLFHPPRVSSAKDHLISQRRDGEWA